MTEDPKNIRGVVTGRSGKGIAMAMAAAALGGSGMLIADEASEYKSEPTPEPVDPEPSREHIKRGVSMSQAMRDMGAKQEQQRRLINRHRVACNDLEGIPQIEVDMIRAAEEKRARRALKRK